MVSIEFLFTSLIVVLIPGTGVLYTVSTGLFLGKRASLFAALGCTLGILPSLLASVLGLAAIFHTSALLFQAVKYLGAAYLLYLAWMMWRSSSPLVLDKDQTQSKNSSIAFRGFIINILNPKLSIFFLAYLPQFISPESEQPLLGMLLLGGVFMLMTFGVFTVYGFVSSIFSELLVHSKKVSTVIQKIFAGSFAALGLKLAFSERG
ncbi:LysE family translocator [Halarcobacter anaerophilus]|uniref:Lysine transporter LysE n=1 Tax=Halarcobacter anaerophilus TaxID=877500 RepID=A0A4V1LQ42_9BACT|nr:LysE family translocator [Halarcobacter anaerophilus]QDF28669.1 transporter, LysE family [Halarcobacter anaerophilus]RXJ63388.1 lysine transporter LysE [Halarcobacter anaerophilus]